MSEAAGPDVLRDEPPYKIVRPYRIRFEEASDDSTTRAAIYLAWMQDIAWQHSTGLGFRRDWYMDRGLTWLVRAVRLDILEPVSPYSTVHVSTQVHGYRRIAARRQTSVFDPDGRPLARAQIDWVMINDRGIPTRVPAEMFGFVPDGSPSFEMLTVAEPAVPPDAFEFRCRVARRDLDPLAHVNNSVYVDYLEEALEHAGAADLLAATPRRYEVIFLAAAERDDVLVGRAWRHGDGWAYLLCRDDGREIFRATVAPHKK